MKARLAVQGATLTLAPAPGSTGVPGTVVVSSAPSSVARAGGQGIYRGNLSVVVSGVTNPAQGATIPTTAETFTIPPTAVKCRVEDLAPIREGDSVTISVSPLIPNSSGPPYPAPTPTLMVVTVQAAGQTKVRGA